MYTKQYIYIYLCIGMCRSRASPYQFVVLLHEALESRSDVKLHIKIIQVHSTDVELNIAHVHVIGSFTQHLSLGGVHTNAYILKC